MSTSRHHVRRGLESLTVTGPSPVLEEVYRDALRAVRNRPSQQAREAALSQAWQAADVDEMWSAIKEAVRAGAPVPPDPGSGQNTTTPPAG